jgi:hypothetical protein
MKLDPKVIIFAAFAGIPGLIVLLGYFLPVLVDLRETLLRWAVIMAAVLLIVGVVNLWRVHWNKFTSRQTGASYSVILLVALGLTLVAAAVGFALGEMSVLTWLFNYIQVPIETSLMAILAVVLAYAVARMFNRRMNLFSFVFILTVLLVLIGTVSLPGIEINFLREIRNWIARVAATAGARGILIGIALGTVATGLRALMGADRPYGE